MGDFDGPKNEKSAPSVAKPQAATPAASVAAPTTDRATHLAEVSYRFSGGRSGTAPGERIASQRRDTIGAAASRIMRKASGSPSTNAGAIPKGSGQPLPPDVQSRMGDKLGADLSSVRVHTGSDSAKASTNFGARAFTVGNDIHFNAGQFAPGTREGDRLLAHELVHVVQGQSSGVQRKPEDDEEAKGDGVEAKGGAPEVSSPDEPAEREADAIADQVTADSDEGKDAKGGEAQGGTAKKKNKENDPQKATPSDANEKPLAIAAKLEGVGRKVFRYEAEFQSNLEQLRQQREPLAKKHRDTRAAVAGAGSLGAIAAAIAGQPKTGDAAIKLNNTEASVARARAYFDAQAGTNPQAATAKQMFVEARYPEALRGQKAGILDAIDKMLAKQSALDDSFGEVDYSNAQWDATQKFTNKGLVLAPENLDAQQFQQTMDLAKSAEKGGIIKLFAMNHMFGGMNPELRQMWIDVYGGDFGAARAAFRDAASAAAAPVTKPPQSAIDDRAKNRKGIKAEDFDAKFSSVTAAFTGEVTGSVGFIEDFKNFNTIADGVRDFGLRPEEYVGGAFLLKIPGAKLDQAVSNAKNKDGTPMTPQQAIGKPSLFTSLLFSEFNYIVEDRIANTTAVNDKSNSGKPDEKGKRELAVVGMSMADFISNGAQFVRA
jgi:hypothetical protein